ncbi:APC family permease [Candidatus Babeliales bacterium]|nr:APC family permease [Candidatus Babeliales bacterium]
MQTKKKISLLSAILISINVILGAGIFINPQILTKITGEFGFIFYIIAALILLPIVLTIASLAQKHPEAGGLYIYSKKYLNPTIGFISTWGYFLGKVSSAALLINIFVSFFQKNIFFLQKIPILYLDLVVIFFLIFLNIMGAKIGGKIQYLFIAFKLIPYLFVAIVGFYFFKPSFFSMMDISKYPEFLSIIPISIFVFLGFEIICSVGHLVENPEKNIKRTILISFSIVAVAVSLFQLAIFGSLGISLKESLQPVSTLASTYFPNFLILPFLLNVFVFGSIISGSFGSLTANCWNLYAIAKDKHLPGNKFLMKVNKYDAPWVSLLIEGIIAGIILAITKNQPSLQSMTVLGMSSAYFCSSIAAFTAQKINNKKKYSYILPILAISSSFYIIYLCLKNLFNYGISFPFLAIFFLGILLKLLQLIKNKRKNI